MRARLANARRRAMKRACAPFATTVHAGPFGSTTCRLPSAKRGRLVFVGYSPDALQVHPLQLVVGEQVVTGSVGNSLAELERAIELVASGRVRTVVDTTLPLERFQDAVDALGAGRLVGRAVLRP